ncbi:acetyl-CoA C-acetyltransferase [Streptomyces sp. NPDC003635]
MTTEAFIYDAIRTPRGRGKHIGALHGTKPITLLTGLIDELRRRHPGLDPAAIDDIVLGSVMPLGDQGGNLGKTAALAAGLPDTVCGMQLNRYCSSGLEAVNTAAARLRSGWDHLIIAGGVESMSRVPMGSDGGPVAFDPDTTTAAQMVPQGIGADLIATVEGFTRDDVDAYALMSQQRAAAAWEGGYFTKSVVPVVDRGVPMLDHDELVRPTTLEGLGALPPSFVSLGRLFDGIALQKYHWLERVDHVHTAGNSSGIVDGAALVLLGSEEIGARYGLTPRARVVAAALTGADPVIMLTGPAPAARKVLDMAGLTTDDIDLFELNEAFASVVLKFVKELELPMDKVNVNGGAIAMGHPMGATGAMLVGTVLDELERRQARRALVTLCIGGGMGIATVIERL